MSNCTTLATQEVVNYLITQRGHYQILQNTQTLKNGKGFNQITIL